MERLDIQEGVHSYAIEINLQKHPSKLCQDNEKIRHSTDTSGRNNKNIWQNCNSGTLFAVK